MRLQKARVGHTRPQEAPGSPRRFHEAPGGPRLMRRDALVLLKCIPDRQYSSPYTFENCRA
eukprot:3736120-Pyramimonas_sp.AAC.1